MKPKTISLVLIFGLMMAAMAFGMLRSVHRELDRSLMNIAAAEALARTSR